MRIELERSLRKFDRAEKIYRELPREQAEHFSVLFQGVHSALGIGDVDLATERLSAFKPQTVASISAVSFLKGKIFETAWNYTEAAEHYKAALDNNAGNASAHWDFAKCQLLLLQPDI